MGTDEKVSVIYSLVYNQALEELPQIENEERREKAVKQYINDMSNTELLELIERATS